MKGILDLISVTLGLKLVMSSDGDLDGYAPDKE
jgi:hypothetical protein